ncbi:MAG: polymer-forming cytoskeletal protein [Candidatus Eisenbacteria bacterium]|uniref:Polymer-forming cytoskeletal protein n=1 Tax=Eiseniibacteriota bacterium TaxID=2212470 RepID=A0A849SWE6_UNCEI|nr:polymer-forming cytoskeletal protein [Candidatus Eisenbacteria bacterium]
MRFRPRASTSEVPEAPNTYVGVGSSVRGTLMITGTLRIDGEYEGDILNCDRLEVGEHGIMRSDVEVKSALILGRVHGSIRALGVIEMKTGCRIEGDVTATSVVMEPGVFFTGRCTMLENGAEAMEYGTEFARARD